MIGPPLTYLHPVPVVLHFLQSMLYPARKGPSLRHNEIRDLTANLLTEVCSNVCVEPELQPLSGESLKNRTANTEDHARLDIGAAAE